MLKSNNVSPNALVESPIETENVVIHPFAVIRPNVTLGKNVIIHPHAVIESGTVIGDGVEIFHHAVIGKPPKGAGVLANTPEFEPFVRIGDNCSIGVGAVLYYDLSIGDNTLIGDGVGIREQVRIGKSCIIGRYVTIANKVKIGSHTRLMDFTSIVGNSEIGDHVFISLHVTTTNDRYFGQHGYHEEIVQGPKIGNRVKIGAGANLLPGVRILDDSLVAAGSIVTKDVPSGAMVLGQPARIVKNAKDS